MGLFNQENLNFSNVEIQVSAAADNKGFVVATKWVKLIHKPFKATLAVTMKASLGRSLHIVESTRYKSWMGTNSHLNLSSDKGEFDKAEHSKDLTKAAMGRSAAIVRFRTLMEENNC